MNFLLAWQLALRYLGLNAGKSVSNARKSLIGAVWGIGISIIPLVIVLVLSDGMIKGISSRMIELGSGHLQGGHRFGRRTAHQHGNRHQQRGRQHLADAVDQLAGRNRQPGAQREKGGGERGQQPFVLPPPKNGLIPRSNDTVAVRGAANRGLMAR